MILLSALQIVVVQEGLRQGLKDTAVPTLRLVAENPAVSRSWVTSLLRPCLKRLGLSSRGVPLLWRFCPLIQPLGVVGLGIIGVGGGALAYGIWKLWQTADDESAEPGPTSEEAGRRLLAALLAFNNQGVVGESLQMQYRRLGLDPMGKLPAPRAQKAGVNATVEHASAQGTSVEHYANTVSQELKDLYRKGAPYATYLACIEAAVVGVAGARDARPVVAAVDAVLTRELQAVRQSRMAGTDMSVSQILNQLPQGPLIPLGPILDALMRIHGLMAARYFLGFQQDLRINGPEINMHTAEHFFGHFNAAIARFSETLEPDNRRLLLEAWIDWNRQLLQAVLHSLHAPSTQDLMATPIFRAVIGWYLSGIVLLQRVESANMESVYQQAVELFDHYSISAETLAQAFQEEHLLPPAARTSMIAVLREIAARQQQHRH